MCFHPREERQEKKSEKRKEEKKGRKRKGKEGNIEYEYSVDDCVGSFFYSPRYFTKLEVNH